MPKSKTKRAEQHRICNLVPSKKTENDWQFGTALEAGVLPSSLAAPASVDLRAAWWTINNQENTGSCVGWASTDGVARYMFVKANRLAQSAKLSPRFTWMASKETDTFVNRPETMIEESGTSLKAAVDILRKFGAVPETMLPFNIATKMYTGNGDTFYATAATRKISAYFNLLKNQNAWKNWLATNRPILVGLGVDATFDNATATGGKLDTFKSNTVRGGHAVALVGYRTDGRFIIRNSWGTAWGDKGFGYASPAYINAGFFNESYGLSL